MDDELTREARKLREEVERYNLEEDGIDIIVMVIIILGLGAAAFFVLSWLGVF